MKNIFRAAVVIVIFLAVGFRLAIAQPTIVISPEELSQWQEAKAPFLLIDVRSSHLFDQKHIGGAMNIPSFIIHKKGLPKDKMIVIYDSGVGSSDASVAAEKLTSIGYESVFVLEGGLARYDALGLPIIAPSGVLDTRLVEFITVEDLSRVISEGLPMTVVDLRTPELFQSGTVPGAQNISPENLLYVSRGWKKDSLIILIDGGDDEAVRQAELLRREGFKMVRYLYGGYSEWQRQNAK